MEFRIANTPPNRRRQPNRPKVVLLGILAIATLLILGFTAPVVLASSGGDTHGNAAESDAAVHGDEAADAHGTEGHGNEGGAHGAGEDTHGEGGGHGGGWAATDTYRVMNFAVLAIALFLIARKPLPKALNSRIDGIREQLDDLEGKKTAAENNLVQYNEKIAALDQESESIVQEYIRQGEDVKVRIIEEAGTAAEKLKEQATKNITNEINMAKDRIKANVVESALQKAEQMVKANITQDDQNRLVDEYLEKVVV